LASSRSLARNTASEGRREQYRTVLRSAAMTEQARRAGYLRSNVTSPFAGFHVLL